MQQRTSCASTIQWTNYLWLLGWRKKTSHSLAIDGTEMRLKRKIKTRLRLPWTTAGCFFSGPTGLASDSRHSQNRKWSASFGFLLYWSSLTYPSTVIYCTASGKPIWYRYTIFFSKAHGKKIGKAARSLYAARHAAEWKLGRSDGSARCTTW